MIHTFFQANMNSTDIGFELVYVTFTDKTHLIEKIVSFDEIKTQKGKYKSKTIYHGLSQNYDEKIYNYTTNCSDKLQISQNIQQNIKGVRLTNFCEDLYQLKLN